MADLPITAKDLRALPDEQVKELLEKLGPEKAEELKYTWPFWARPDQLEPRGKWKIWMPLAGRGWGKTRCGAEWVRHRVMSGDKRIACIAPTKGDVRRVMVEGESGLLNVCWKNDTTYKGQNIGKPIWQPTNNTITWENGAKAEFFSAEDPERLRGPQFHSAWCFTEGHEVETEFGAVPVEDIRVGSKVYTSDGLEPVSHTSAREMPVGIVKFSDGTTLEGTYDHPIFTQRGWIPLGELTEGDLCPKLSTMATFGVSTHKDTTIQQVKELFTDTLLGSTSETLKDSTSTTSTGTNSTTTQVTCNFSQDQNTSNYTTEKEVQSRENLKVNGSSLVTVVGKLFSGVVGRIGAFTAKVANTVGLKKKESNLQYVLNAGKLLTPEWELSALNVVSTWQPTGVKPVHNIRVENTHEYFCNGILTHNCDELAAWRNVQDVWDMLQFTLRLGRNPRILVTTTPKPIKLVRRIVDLGKEDPERYIVTTGTSYDNKDNIDLEALSSYEGTRLGRQELYAEILEEAAGALWSMELLDKAQVHKEEVPLLDEDKGFKKDNLNLQRIVVAIDPAITSNEESDMTGIVVAGIDVNGTGYVLEDATDNYKPAEWAQKAIDLFYEYKADRIVAERNQGGDMVKHTLQTEDSSVPLRLVHASRGKYARAEPVSALYEQERVKHLPNLDDLERQMTTWEPLGKMGSPDRLDACVWALTDLMLGGVARPQLTLSYKNAKEAAA